MDATTQSWAAAYIGSAAAAGVRLHTDAAAAASAAAVDAAAYTVGRHVVFAADAFQPSTEAGRRLLVHELSHVIQQGVRDPMQTDDLKVLPRHHSAERSAALVAGGTGPVVEDHCELSVARQHVQTLPAAPAAAALPSAEELTRRIVQAIGVWETNRGGAVPRPRESELQTVAGIPASMATTEQATMPYLVGNLRQHAELRDLATPPLTPQEIEAAQQRINSVDALLDSVGAGTRAGTAPEAFIQANSAQIIAAGMTEDNVRTMFGAVALHATVAAAHAPAATAAEQAVAAARAANPNIPPQEIEAIRRRTTREAAAPQAAAIPENQRLGISASSLTTYIASPGTWGENRAAWRRLAVQRMPNGVGQRIESVGLAQHGTAVATTVIRRWVDDQLARTPPLTEEHLVVTVATRNNPGEPNYGANVWRTYQRLLHARPPAPQAPQAPPATSAVPAHEPPPPQAASGPALLPAPGPPPPQPFTPLPGAPGPSPQREAMEKVTVARSMTEDLLRQGEALERRLGSDNPPSTDELGAFARAEVQWRRAATISWEYFKAHPTPDEARAAFDELLHSDKYGGRLSQIYQRLLHAQPPAP